VVLERFDVRSGEGQDERSQTPPKHLHRQPVPLGRARDAAPELPPRRSRARPCSASASVTCEY
jgi:hypothetical protein